MDKFSAPTICRQLDAFADNTEDMLHNEPVQACRKALRVPSAARTAACMATCR